MYRISVVVPVYNEEGNAAQLHEEIKEVLEKAKKSRILSRQLEVEISEDVYESIKEEINK